MKYPFFKMHALGNDFVVMDAREKEVNLSPPTIQALANRHTGIGFDQLIFLKPASAGDVLMEVINADGGAGGFSGNGARCVALLVHQQTARQTIEIEIPNHTHLYTCEVKSDKIRVGLGPPALEWDEIPLKEAHDVRNVPVHIVPLETAVCVNVGNPHAVFFVEDLLPVDLAALGPKVEHHPLFPERINVEIAQVKDRHTIHLKVWERGTGLTQACGSGAAATQVAARLSGFTEEKVTVVQPGGTLEVEFDQQKSLYLTGNAHFVFEGHIEL